MERYNHNFSWRPNIFVMSHAKLIVNKILHYHDCNAFPCSALLYQDRYSYSRTTTNLGVLLINEKISFFDEKITTKTTLTMVSYLFNTISGQWEGLIKITSQTLFKINYWLLSVVYWSKPSRKQKVDSTIVMILTSTFAL